MPTLTQQQLDNLRKKYSNEQIKQVASKYGYSVPEEKKPLGGIAGFAVGAGKGLLRTVIGAGQLGYKPFEKITGIPGPVTPQMESQLEPRGTAQKAGFATERIAEFLVPSTKIAKAKTLATGALKGPGFLRGVGRVGTRSAIEAGTVGTQTALQQGEFGDEAKTSAIISSVFPVLGATTRITGRAIGGTGEKILVSKIKPLQSEIDDGFKAENLRKYNVAGSLKQMLEKTNTRLNQLAKEKKELLKDSTKTADIKNVLNQTIRDLNKNKTRLKNLGDLKSIKNQTNKLKEELQLALGKDFNVSLDMADRLRRGAGVNSSWINRLVDPDANAKEVVYGAFYKNIKKEILKKSAKKGKLGQINSEITDLIPINNALLKRVPKDAKNNPIGLTNSIFLGASAFDPSALALLGANVLSKSGRFANLLIKASDTLQKQAQRPITRRILGQ